MSSTVISEPRYNDKSFQTFQDQLDAAIERGISPTKLETFFVGFYTEQSKVINPNEIQDVSMGTLERKILRPRQDLYLFVLYNWLKFIFLPTLDRTIIENLLIFGVGRIFSSYSNVGVQYCTDADLNFVAMDSVSKADITALASAVKKLKQRIWDLFCIIVEVDASFTVLRAQEIKERLMHSNREARMAATLFYKGNADSLFVIHDNPELREDIFKQVRQLPDSLLFDNFLGYNPVKTTFARLRDDNVKLSIISDSTQQKETVDALIGTKMFSHKCRQLAGIHPELYPQKWCFSMKYTVNRIYDYVSAMHHAGYSLKDLGFSGDEDPDYRFVCQAHRLMLFLQELIHIRLDTYNYLSDYSYINADRFINFMGIPKGSFRSDFDEIVLSPNFLHASERKHYLALKQYIHDKELLNLSMNEEQVIELRKQFGLEIHHLGNGSGKNPVTVPYTWGGVGFFVFNAVENRLSAIVDEKLVPSLKMMR